MVDSFKVNRPPGGEFFIVDTLCRANAIGGRIRKNFKFCKNLKHSRSLKKEKPWLSVVRRHIEEAWVKRLKSERGGVPARTSLLYLTLK